MIYNSFVSSLLSYIWQLSTPNSCGRKAEWKALNRLVPGPGCWVQPRDLWRLQAAWGFSAQFTSLHHRALAVAVRVGLATARDFRRKAREMREALNNIDLIGKRAYWKEWYDSSFYTHIESAYDRCKALSISPSRMLIQLVAKAGGGDDHLNWALHSIEGKLYDALLRADCLDNEMPAVRARTALCRWAPRASPSDATRFLRISGIVGKFTQPCVHVAVIWCWKWVGHGKEDAHPESNSQKTYASVDAPTRRMTRWNTTCVARDNNAGKNRQAGGHTGLHSEWHPTVHPYGRCR